jgi:asparagine synthase (glutamine-hydrolysing)
MCGIFGVVNFNEIKVNNSLLKQATRLMTHRGPNGEGYYFNDSFSVGLGHQRLSILDIESGNQPMTNENGTIWIVFNGEIYNYLELKSYLISKGHKFRTKSDTEVLIHAYEEFGEDMTKKLNGIFAFAIWDEENNKLFLSRDHFGVKPLYYYHNSHNLVFASELKSILLYTNISREINEKALFLCLNFRQTPAPNTLFNEIKKLPAAHSLLINRNKIELRKYWDYKFDLTGSDAKEDNYEKLKYGIENAVKRQMMADVPIGISLSGGLDSGIILGLMSKYSNKGVHAFTVGFEGNKEEKNEIALARENASRFGADFNFEIISDSDYLGFMDKYIWHMEEPVGNESAIAYYFVASLANKKVKVLLNGQGADEPLAGYNKYIGMYYADKYKIPNFLLKSISQFNNSLRRQGQLKKLIEYKEQTDEYFKIASSSSILNVELRKSLFNSDFQKYNNPNLILHDIKYTLDNFIKGSTLEKNLFYDMFSLLSENLLLSEDKMSMAAGIEARVPFLDIDLVKTMLSIKAKHKIKGLSGKHPLKEVGLKYLPKQVVYQKKIGFNNPMGKWMKSSLGTELLDLVNSNDSITNKYLNIEFVNELYHQHKNGSHNNLRLLFLLLSIEKWNTTFIQK